MECYPAMRWEFENESTSRVHRGHRRPTSRGSARPNASAKQREGVSGLLRMLCIFAHRHLVFASGRSRPGMAEAFQYQASERLSFAESRRIRRLHGGNFGVGRGGGTDEGGSGTTDHLGWRPWG